MFSAFSCHEVLGSIPGWGAKILQAARCSQKKKGFNFRIVAPQPFYYHGQQSQLFIKAISR